MNDVEIQAFDVLREAVKRLPLGERRAAASRAIVDLSELLGMGDPLEPDRCGFQNKYFHTTCQLPIGHYGDSHYDGLRTF